MGKFQCFFSSVRKLQLSIGLFAYDCIFFSLNLDQEASLSIIFYHILLNILMSKGVKLIAHLPYVGNLGTICKVICVTTHIPLKVIEFSLNKWNHKIEKPRGE